MMDQAYGLVDGGRSTFSISPVFFCEAFRFANVYGLAVETFDFIDSALRLLFWWTVLRF